MSLFKILRRHGTPSSHGVQAPFAQSGPASQPDADINQYSNRIRILIIGRANAGKTTILQKVCGATKLPEVFDVDGNRIEKGNFLTPSHDRGVHNINNSTVFQSNPSFIFHDSRGFESGDTRELDEVKAFISARSNMDNLADRIHAVWYCIPLDDDRPFLTAEKDFFSECGTGDVPVIVIFTKFDAMDDKAFAELIESDMSIDDARAQAPGYAVAMFERDLRDVLYGMKYPPKTHVLLRDMNLAHASCQELVNCTANEIDNKVLKRLFISNQRSNLRLCIESAMDELGILFRTMEVVKMQKAIMNCFPHCVVCYTFFF
ncbi:hypothetical protein FIBSPDRAFT_919288 [Athelia psychrophila]|uniref:Uncharacterized protein n=1 Tax=Athelia psychrophila TaxID=1759441 RepID=A0A166LCV0_9AGAM|nr:hypothetical protein FIBSPDRAFT_919288 [Fibularhizoctonia sp. CBS 109695]